MKFRRFKAMCLSLTCIGLLRSPSLEGFHAGWCRQQLSRAENGRRRAMYRGRGTWWCRT